MAARSLGAFTVPRPLGRLIVVPLPNWLDGGVMIGLPPDGPVPPPPPEPPPEPEPPPPPLARVPRLPPADDGVVLVFRPAMAWASCCLALSTSCAAFAAYCAASCCSCACAASAAPLLPLALTAFAVASSGW